MNKTHMNRLRTLYSVIAGVPEGRIDLYHWHSCGTAACAVGWACEYPPFQEEGFAFKTPTHRSETGSPAYGDRLGWGAVSSFFGMSSEKASMVFMSTRSQDTYAVFRFTDQNVPVSKGVPNISDKRLVLMRIRNYLHEIGAITTARNQELALQEKTGKL
jgi:hypothetical protein